MASVKHLSCFPEALVSIAKEDQTEYRSGELR